MSLIVGATKEALHLITTFYFFLNVRNKRLYYLTDIEFLVT